MHRFHEGQARVHLALATVAVLFSANYIIAKFALEHFNSFAFVWLRVAGSAVALQAIVAARGENRFLPRSDFKTTAVYSLLGVVANQLLFITGLSMTTAHEAAILITTVPIATLIGALALGTEKANSRQIGGIAIAAIGALLLLIPKAGAPAATATNRVLGDLLIIINCASYGIYLVVSREIMKRYSALRVVAQIFATGTLLMLPFCIAGLVRTRWAEIPLSAWGALLAVIAGPTVGAYLLNGWALARASSTAVAAYTYVQPLLASLLAWSLLGEHLSAGTFAAAALIIAGVFLAGRRRGRAIGSSTAV